MKTKQLFFNGMFLVAFCFNASAQVTQATNAITSTSYVGTSNNFDVVFKRQAVTSGLLSINTTSFGLNSLSMPNSVSFGVNAGQFSSGTGGNTYVGQNAGKGLSLTTLNSGSQNTFSGNSSGQNNTTGYNNTFSGYGSGSGNETGFSNVFIGSLTGQGNLGGNYNTYIGTAAGMEESNSGSGNVFLGYYAGFSEHEVSNRLIIGNNETVQLIWGDFALNHLKFNAKVGVGYNFGSYPTTAGSVDVSAYNLFVKGGMLTEEVRVMLQSDWADYVFTKEYKLPTLSEVEDFIAKNGHLPNVPSAQQVKEDGIALGEMAKIQQEKIEELTLYVLQLNKENEKQAKENTALNERLLKLENLVDNLAK